MLGPLLYNLFTSDIPKSRHCKIAQFADDTALYFSHRNLRPLRNRLQDDLNTLTQWFCTWRIKINTKKTTAILFSRRRRSKRPDEIIVENIKISWTGQAKYLEVTLDSQLTFTQHTKQINQKIAWTTKILHPFINPKSRLTLDNKIKLIEIICIQIATCAGEI